MSHRSEFRLGQRALHSTEICVLPHYLLKQKEILDAVHRHAVCIQQAVELET